ncbi:hypothetical protein V1281_002627 [Nitrobacteraceae bacterium AZCC 2161]
MTINYITDDARIPRPTLTVRSAAGKFKSASGSSYCQPMIAACKDASILAKLLYTFDGNRGAAYEAIGANLGLKRRTLHAWARAVNALGLDVLERIVATPLDSAREVEALCCLPEAERTDLLKELASGTSAVRRLKAVELADRENQTDEISIMAGQIAGKPLHQQYRFFDKFAQAVADLRQSEKRELSVLDQVVAAITERDFARRVAKDAQARIDQMSRFLTPDALDHVQLDINRMHAEEIEREPDNIFADSVEEIAQSLISLKNGHRHVSTFEAVAA